MALADWLFAGLALWSAGRSLKRALQDGDRSSPRKRRLGDSSRLYDVHNIDQRVSHITRLVQKGRTDPKVVMLARQIVSQRCGDRWCIPERDYQGEVAAVFHFTKQNVRYVRDAWGIDQFTSARRTLYEGKAEDCDGQAIVVGSLLQAIGYPVRLRVIWLVGDPDWGHIYVVVGLPPGGVRQWVALDTTVDEPPGWEPPRHEVKAVKDFEVP